MAKRFGAAADTGLSITIETESVRTIVSLAGEIDAVNSLQLRAVLGEQVDDDHDVVMDLSGVRFIDSSGLGVLVGALRRFNASGHQLALRGLSPSLMRVLEVTGLADAFPIEH